MLSRKTTCNAINVLNSHQNSTPAIAGFKLFIIA